MSATGVVTRSTLALALVIAVSPAARGANLAPGDVLWSRVFAGGNHFNVPNSIGALPDGGTVFVTGSTGQGSVVDMATAAYDASTGGTIDRVMDPEGRVGFGRSERAEPRKGVSPGRREGISVTTHERRPIVETPPQPPEPEPPEPEPPKPGEPEPPKG